ncbi:MAG: carboxypeptidase-like regulatory domain-containing protein [Ignavibacteria bacterium]|jgi:hypothetical protein
MKYILPVILSFILIFSFLYSGCSPTSSDSGTAILRGIVRDTTKPSGQQNIVGATVFLDQVNYTTTTNDLGIFTFTNLSGGIYNITITNPGYFPFTTSVEVITDDTTNWITAPLSYRNIYAYNNIILDINNAGYFYINARSVPNDSPDKDVQIIDSLVDSETYIYLRSADQDLINPGYQTWFSNRYIEDCNQILFDTLPKYVTEDGYINPDRDFPNHTGLDYYIDINNYKHSVWFFYLKGRYPATSPRVYGAMYIDSAWYDAGQNLRGLRVDIKINARGENNFNPYVKK